MMALYQLAAVLVPLLIWPLLAIVQAHRWLPRVRYVDSMPAGVLAQTKWGGLLISVLRTSPWPDASEDHEREHVFYRLVFCLVFYALLVRTSESFQVWIETRCYAASVRGGRPLDDAAHALASYGLTVDEARERIRKLL